MEIEKRTFNNSHQTQFHKDRQSKNDNSPSSVLLELLPKSLKLKYEEEGDPHQTLCNCINSLHLHSRIEELNTFFNEIGANVSVWIGKSTVEEKTQYLFDCLDRNVEESIKKVTHQANNYITNVLNISKVEKNKITEKSANNDFDWLFLNTKNEMLKPKLKTKLVQAINEFKNEKKLREVMGKQLEDHEKVHLEDEELDFYQDEMSKINYEWNEDDEEMLLNNIKCLKDKFNQTEFLRNCQRFKYVTDSEIKTLASEEISRKLDKSNKAFLSREFLLDKYFSTKETLTEKEMKFILKTSPLLSRCVDKAFVRAAVKNIQYEDIDKMELQIAEEIIEKFETIRNLVRESRRTFKQTQNNKAKERIEIFERAKSYDFLRRNMNDNLLKHKQKMIRNLNYKHKPGTTQPKEARKNKENIEALNEKNSKIPQKMVWPVPLNCNHPSTSLFIRDCSEQINDEFNEYEKSYLKEVFDPQNQYAMPKSPNFQASMVKFYTGGPMEQVSSNKSSVQPLFNSKALREEEDEGKNKNTAKIMCEIFKTIEYNKEIKEKLSTYDFEEDIEEISTNILKEMDGFVNDNTKGTRKEIQFEDDLVSGKKIKNGNETEKTIRNKIIEGREKAKMSVFVKKLLCLAAENSFVSLKALNVKFTPSQINTIDSKGNTALFYATKHRNSDFIEYLLSFKADVNVKCSKGTTPLHNAFRSSNYSIICKCLTSSSPPNLNALDDEGNTPLAYCFRNVLEMLGLENGTVNVSAGKKMKFDNNGLLCLNVNGNNGDDELEMRMGLARKDVVKDLIV